MDNFIPRGFSGSLWGTINYAQSRCLDVRNCDLEWIWCVQVSRWMSHNLFVCTGCRISLSDLILLLSLLICLPLEISWNMTMRSIGHIIAFKDDHAYGFMIGLSMSTQRIFAGVCWQSSSFRWQILIRQIVDSFVFRSAFFAFTFVSLCSSIFLWMKWSSELPA